MRPPMFGCLARLRALNLAFNQRTWRQRPRHRGAGEERSRRVSIAAPPWGGPDTGAPGDLDHYFFAHARSPPEGPRGSAARGASEWSADPSRWEGCVRNSVRRPAMHEPEDRVMEWWGELLVPEVYDFHLRRGRELIGIALRPAQCVHELHLLDRGAGDLKKARARDARPVDLAPP